MISDPSQRMRPLVGLVFMGIGCFVLTQLALHYLQPELKPLDEAMSYYVYGRQGWLLTLGLFSLGVGSLVLTIVLAWGLAATVSRGGLWCLAIWSAGVLFGAAFAADPPGRWDKPPSISGSIHGIAAMIALVSFPIAALLLSRDFRSDSRWIGRSRILGTLAIASGVSLLFFFASLAPVFVRPGPPILLGLTERLLFAVYLAWLCARWRTGSIFQIVQGSKFSDSSDFAGSAPAPHTLLASFDSKELWNQIERSSSTLR